MHNLKDNNIYFTKVRNVKTPSRANKDAAGIDFFIPEDYPTTVLKHGESVKIPSGIHLKVPEGCALVFENKSGVSSKKKLDVLACVVDSDYEGEVHLNLINNGLEDTVVNPGEKIIQGVVYWLNMSDVLEKNSVDELYKNSTSTRKDGGFGSTGDF